MRENIDINQYNYSILTFNILNEEAKLPGAKDTTKATRLFDLLEIAVKFSLKSLPSGWCGFKYSIPENKTE